MNRRSFLQAGSAATALGIMTRAERAGAQTHEGHGAPGGPTQGQTAGQTPPPAATPAAVARRFPAGQPGVTVPNGGTLPLRVVDGVKVGHLVVESFPNAFSPDLTAEVWGYNGTTPGPVIELVEGDRLRMYVTNRLPEPTTVHWHGIVLPNGMDGVSGLNQRPIPPGETWVYEFTLRHPGTFMYHSHFDEMTQIALGAVGMIVVHPRQARGPRVDRDFVLMAHEWKIEAGARRPDPNAMNDFNVLTFNGKAFPSTEPLLVGKGERVRIRLGNLGPMDHHPIHIHGLWFHVTATDGGYVPASAQRPETTVLVPVGATRVIEFVPPESGDWAMHCHMTHHVMMQMAHGLPNMVGMDPRVLERRMSRAMPEYMTMGHRGMGGMGEMRMEIPPNSAPMRGGPGPHSYIDMGGMFTVLKVRDDVATADPAGWYQAPAGTVPAAADEARLRADGIDVARTWRRG